MTPPTTLLISDGITVKKIPTKMFATHQDQVRQVTMRNLQDIASLHLEEIVRIFRGNAFVGVSKKNLDGLVSSWIIVWEKNGRF